uniref:5'-deoxynucleotidase HDDC2 n=1 Tax=Ciona savignyi TaxID=51511 RepID=H2Y8K7_CIOSA
MSADMIKFLSLVGQLKRTKRSGWVLRGVNEPESVSDHMYRMAVMAMVCKDASSSLDRNRCIKLCLVHDMAECIVGDITPQDNIPKEEKHRKEKAAMSHMCSLIDVNMGQELIELFEEYEAQSSPEARYVKDLDRFDMILQAQHYEDEESNPGRLQEFFDSVEGKIQDKEIVRLADELTSNRK